MFPFSFAGRSKSEMEYVWCVNFHVFCICINMCSNFVLCPWRRATVSVVNSGFWLRVWQRHVPSLYHVKSYFTITIHFPWENEQFLILFYDVWLLLLQCTVIR
jgi:hypothetical protein